MTIFKVGDMVTPIPGEQYEMVVSQLKARGRDTKGLLTFRVVEVSTLINEQPVLYYECGYHSYDYRMQHAAPLNKSLEDYL